MNGESGAGGGEGSEVFSCGHRRGAAGGAGQHHRLRDFGQRQFFCQRGGSGSEGRNAGRNGEGNLDRGKPPQLFAERAPDRQIAGMQPRDVLTLLGGPCHLRDDLVERHRRGIENTRAGRAEVEQRFRHQRSGIETDRARRDQVAAAQRDEIGRAGAGADEVNRHGPSPMAMAQVALAAAILAPRSLA